MDHTMKTVRARHVSAAILFISCATTNEAKYPDVPPQQVACVKVAKAEPGEGCREVGPIDIRHVTPFQTATYAGAVEQMRYEAASKGGNYVVLDVVRQEGGRETLALAGRLFSCTNTAPAAPASTLPPSGACEPQCSPGYVCIRGNCVSACNPPCDKGERCGEDRSCHPKT